MVSFMGQVCPNMPPFGKARRAKKESSLVHFAQKLYGFIKKHTLQ
jgi:hypothetical protein